MEALGGNSKLKVKIDPNMYRTSYHDMTNGLEVCIKSNFPCGYGGDILPLRHNILFINTKEAKEIKKRQKDKKRDTYGQFNDIIQGIPYLTKNAKPKKEGPSYGFFCPFLVSPPWALDVPRKGWGTIFDYP